jgi:imidazole glycerol-phosphate synthase subunit HisH
MMRVAVVDYGSGNLASASRALALAAERIGIKAQVDVTADPDVVAAADRIVLPGQGAFADCSDGLAAVRGMREAIETATAAGTPFLGICVGMQLLADVGREFGDHPGLGWIKGDVVRITPSDPALKIPHMGWNELAFVRPHPLFAGLEPGAHAYFVHSYVIRPADPAAVLATTEYSGPFAAAVGRANIVGTQFHPEKSQATGLAILANFLRWTP